MTEKILITSALPYANGPLHFGHIAGAYLPADAHARFQRLMKKDVLYICGSDEYGVAITLSADLAGRTPQEHVNIFHEINKNFFQQLHISFDHYSRTTWKGHAAPVQKYFLDLLKNGYIEEKVTEQLYSEKEGRFLADRYVEGTCPKCGNPHARGDECTNCGASFEATELINPRSKISHSPLILKPTKHWFIRLDLFKERLSKWLETKDWKNNVVNFVKGYIDELRPRAITRDSNWGVPIPLPNTEGKVLYVWFDAPIGYISATQEWDNEKWKLYWLDPATKLIHFIGKDNIPFHAVIFPAMTMGQDEPYKLVDELPANEFYKLEGRQFSKSDGWMIDFERFFQRYTSDQIRYTIAANAPETADSEFTWHDFQNRCNAELVGKFGNLVNRTLVFAKTRTDQKVPSRGSLEPIDEEFLKNLQSLLQEIQNEYQAFRLRRVCQLLMELATLGNVYFDTKSPWKDAKIPETLPRMQTTIALCLEGIKLLALAAYPIIPDSAEKIWKMLGYQDTLLSDGWEKIAATPIPSGQLLKDPEVLFRKIEDSEIDEELALLQQMSKKHEKPVHTPLKDPVDIDTFKKLDLRVGQILEAEPVPKSKKLLKLLVDLGFEKRQIVSGIHEHYKPHDLIGRKVVIVANLKPATLMGIESQGMVLAASDKTSLELVNLDHMPLGASVN